MTAAIHTLHPRREADRLTLDSLSKFGEAILYLHKTAQPMRSAIAALDECAEGYAAITPGTRSALSQMAQHVMQIEAIMDQLAATQAYCEREAKR